jgi:hypothetical protein
MTSAVDILARFAIALGAEVLLLYWTSAYLACVRRDYGYAATSSPAGLVQRSLTWRRISIIAAAGRGR